MPYDFFGKLHKLLVDDKSLTFHLNGKQMIINFDKTHVYEETGKNVINN